MKKKFILVVNHPRSGSHFLINSLCLNLKNTEFPVFRTFHASLENLFLSHDSSLSDEWEKCVFTQNGKIKIFKTHVLPSEIHLALKDKYFMSEQDRRILREIYENSEIFYVHRDGRDTLASWYHYQKEAGHALPQGGMHRISECSFSEFIRMPNKFYMPNRGFEEQDKNNVVAWARHIEDWLSEAHVRKVSYESLLKDFDTTIKKVVRDLELEDLLFDKINKPQIIKQNKMGFTAPMLRRLKRIQEYVVFGFHRKVSVDMPISFPRKGTSGYWKEHFSEDDLKFFLEHAGETFKKLNYEV